MQRIVQLGVFISCTEELAIERQILEGLVQELNSQLSDTYSVTLQPLTWHSAVVPGVGSDPQAVINSQIDTEYDIYVGLLASRFGTETPRAGSGTEEEFERAYGRYRSNPEKVRLLFYFKDGPSPALSRIDPQQLAKVQEFRNKLSNSRGVLYQSFQTERDFVPLIRQHLYSLVAKQWKGDSWEVLTRAPETITHPTVTSPSLIHTPFRVFSSAEFVDIDHDDKGILDCIDEANEARRVTHESLDKIARCLTTGAQKMRQASAKLEKPPSKKQNARFTREVVNTVGDEFTTLARVLRQEVPVVVSSYSAMAIALETAIAIHSESGIAIPEEAQRVIAEMPSSERVIELLRCGIVSAEETLSDSPELTANFKRGKKALVRQMDYMRAAMALLMDRTQTLTRKFQKLRVQPN